MYYSSSFTKTAMRKDESSPLGEEEKLIQRPLQQVKYSGNKPVCSEDVAPASPEFAVEVTEHA